MVSGEFGLPSVKVMRRTEPVCEPVVARGQHALLVQHVDQRRPEVVDLAAAAARIGGGREGTGVLEDPRRGRVRVRRRPGRVQIEIVVRVDVDALSRGEVQIELAERDLVAVERGKPDLELSVRNLRAAGNKCSQMPSVLLVVVDLVAEIVLFVIELSLLALREVAAVLLDLRPLLSLEPGFLALQVSRLRRIQATGLHPVRDSILLVMFAAVYLGPARMLLGELTRSCLSGADANNTEHGDERDSLDPPFA